jgi:hypothetical protein
LIFDVSDLNLSVMAANFLNLIQIPRPNFLVLVLEGAQSSAVSVRLLRGRCSTRFSWRLASESQPTPPMLAAALEWRLRTRISASPKRRLFPQNF